MMIADLNVPHMQQPLRFLHHTGSLLIRTKLRVEVPRLIAPLAVRAASSRPLFPIAIETIYSMSIQMSGGR
jgi:hypothetical protein